MLEITKSNGRTHLGLLKFIELLFPRATDEQWKYTAFCSDGNEIMPSKWDREYQCKRFLLEPRDSCHLYLGSIPAIAGMRLGQISVPVIEVKKRGGKKPGKFLICFLWWEWC